MFTTTIRVAIHQRAVLLQHGVPIRALEPGKHTFWRGGLSTHLLDTRELILDESAEIRRALPQDWFDEVLIGQRQRGLLYRDAVPVRYLRPGIHRYWKVNPTVELNVWSIDDPLPALTDALVAVIPRSELVNVTVQQHQRGLKYEQGKFAGELPPGRHLFWSPADARVTVQLVDVRLQQLTISGQELMTRDKVTLRLTLTVEYQPADAPTAVHATANLQDAIYLMVQLASRDYVAGVTLDELLEGRDAMTRYLHEAVVPGAHDLGVSITRVGVKDVVLPGEMKLLLNRVIEAEKEAAANVIRRREEAAATRSMANTAKVIADNPVLMELKKLEALQEIAARIDEVRLMIGADAAGELLRGQLLGIDKN